MTMSPSPAEEKARLCRSCKIPKTIRPNGKQSCKRCIRKKYLRHKANLKKAGLKRKEYRSCAGRKEYLLEYQSREYVKERERERARVRFQDPGEKYKSSARSTFRRAVSAGKIARQPCCVCGESNAEGHHEDYSKPFEVIWLCSKHHVHIHRGLLTLQGAIG